MIKLPKKVVNISLEEIKDSDLSTYKNIMNLCLNLDQEDFPEVVVIKEKKNINAGLVESLYKKFLQKKKDKKAQARLKQAEKIIMKMGVIIEKRAAVGRATEHTHGQVKRDLLEETTMTAKTKELFNKIGITDESKMSIVLNYITETQLEDRVEMAFGLLPEPVASRIFSLDLRILKMTDDDFLSEVDNIQTKILIMDEIKKVRGSFWGKSEADYEKNPGILLMDLRDIATLAKNIAADTEKAEKIEERQAETKKTRIKLPVTKGSTLIKTLEKLGCGTRQSAGSHITIWNPDSIKGVPLQATVIKTDSYGDVEIRVILKKLEIDVQKLLEQLS